MSDAATMPEAVPADALLGAAAEMPTPTPGISSPSHTSVQDPPAPVTTEAPAPGILDRKGNKHDPVFHEVPARLNAEGLWAKRRGNAARKAKGLPPSGSTFGAGFKPAAPAVDQAATPPPAAAPASASVPPPVDALNGQPPVVDGVPSPEPMGLPLEAYATTAGGIVDGTLGLAQIGISEAWKATPQERTVLVGAVQRVWHEHQWPILGSVVELILVVIGFAAKRKDDPTTRKRFGALWDWISRKPKQAPGTYAPPSSPAVAPPAAPPVDAYTVTGGDAPPASQPGRVAWG